MGRASVSWCLVPPNLVFQKSFPRARERCVQTEKLVWVVHFTITTFHLLHSSSPVCTCRLLVSLLFQNTCLYLMYLLVGFLHICKQACALFLETFTATIYRWASDLWLTRVMLGWLLGHCLTASTVSHATAPVPPGLPGPASPEARARREKPKATSLFSDQTWNSCNSRLPWWFTCVV